MIARDADATTGEQETPEEEEESQAAETAKYKLARGRLLSDQLEDDERSSSDSAEWMMTYMDTITLLVTLFVILITMSPIGDATSKNTKSFFNTGSGNQGILVESVPKIADPIKPETDTSEANANNDEGLAAIKDQIAAQGIPDLVDVRVVDNKINLEINDKVLFAVGQADLTLEGRNLLVKLKTVIEQGQSDISVEGHTDNTPIKNDRFPSNWELSAGRASTVVRFFIGEGILANRLEAVGHADTRPVDENVTESGRSRNRRVNIILKFEKNRS